MTALRLAPLLLLAACASSHRAIVRELERRAMERPRPAADRLLARGGDAAAPLLACGGPFTLSMERGVEVPVARGRVNGVEAPLLLDTGTSQVFLSAPVARDADLYLPPSEAVDAFTPGYAVPLRAGVFDSLALGGASFGAGVALVGVREAGADREYRGIVGMSVLSHFRVTFDFREREVRLEPHGEPGYVNPLMAPVAIDGRPYLLMVDSGASRLFLEPWAARELGLIPDERAEEHSRKALDPDDARFTWVKVKSVEVQGRKFEDVSAAVVNTFEGVVSEGGHRPAGLLGLAAFGKLRWTVDFARREVRIDG